MSPFTATLHHPTTAYTIFSHPAYCPLHIHSSQDPNAHLPLATVSQTTRKSLPVPYLHIDKGPQVPPRQPQEQLNQGRVGSLDSQVQNGLVALDLLGGEEQQRSGQPSIHSPGSHQEYLAQMYVLCTM